MYGLLHGVYLRLMGALIMTHSDDNGLVLPPHLAPIQVVIVPIYKNDEQLKQIDAKVEGIVAKLRELGISVKYDNADNKRPGFKFADYELKGVPVRLVMGGRDLENNTMEIMRRDTLEKETRTCEGIEEYVKNLLEDIQNNIYQKALNYRKCSYLTKWIHTMSSRNRSKRVALSLLTGTELRKQKTVSRKKPNYNPLSAFRS